MEIILDIAATHLQGANVRDGMGPPYLRQTLKSRFESSRNYANALLEKRLVFLRKPLKEVSKTLVEVLFKLMQQQYS